MQCVTLLLINVGTGLQELYATLLVQIATQVREFLENTLEVLADEFRYLHGLFV